MRFNRILLVFFGMGFGYFIRRAGFHKHIHPLNRMGPDPKVKSGSSAENFRKALEKLGPVFIKFGQILSTRSDIMPKEFVRELQKLQAKVPPFPFYKARRLVEKSFGRPLNKIFKKFETEPFAAASLGQVYRAQLHSGQKVAVKVQRPKAKDQIKLDTEVLLVVAHLLHKHFARARDLNLIEVVQEFRRWTLNELDYRKEATNCEIFNNFFKDDPNIYGPKVFWDYTTDSVLTLEFVDGESLSAVIAKKPNNKGRGTKLAHLITDSFIKQFFDYGFFHADPHPGNIFALKDGSVLFLDFGMVGFLDDKLTGIGAAAFLALIQKDVDSIVALLLRLEEDYDERADRTPVREIVKVNSLRKELNELILQWSVTSQAGSFTRLFYEVMSVAVRNGISVPTDLVMLSKSIVTLDVVVKQLDGKFRIEEWEQPMVEKIIARKLSGKRVKSRLGSVALAVEELITHLPDTAGAAVRNLEHGNFGMEINADQLMEYERLLNSNSRISAYGTLLAAIVIASALIYSLPGQPEIWGLNLGQIGLYGGLLLVGLYFLSTNKKGSSQ